MSSRKKKINQDDEVEELLRAAEDSMLLKLSVNSHMSRGSSTTIIDPDVDRRFQALRSKPTPPSKSKPNPLPNPPPVIAPSDLDLDRDEKPKEDDDDLFARFAALKSSIPAYSSSTPLNLNEEHQKLGNDDDSDDEEDEVEKLIRWAVDAARLDPSPPSDTDDDPSPPSDTDDANDSEDDDDDDRVDDKKKKKKKGKQK